MSCSCILKITPLSVQQGILSSSEWHSSGPKEATAEGLAGRHAWERGAGVHSLPSSWWLPHSLGGVLCRALPLCGSLSCLERPEMKTGPCRHGPLIVVSGLFSPDSWGGNARNHTVMGQLVLVLCVCWLFSYHHIVYRTNCGESKWISGNKQATRK